jgi:1,4-alpha-glucan branching enzyme
MRKGKKAKDNLLIILNVTPVVRHDWEIFVHGKGKWKEVFNSNATEYWGTGDVFNPTISSKLVDKPSQCYQIKLNLPALGAIVLK